MTNNEQKTLTQLFGNQDDNVLLYIYIISKTYFYLKAFLNIFLKNYN